jgi:hypothetical protein
MNKPALRKHGHSFTVRAVCDICGRSALEICATEAAKPKAS